MQQLCRPFLHAMTGGRAPTFLELDGSQETVVEVARSRAGKSDYA
jgi:hypothetical protein